MARKRMIDPHIWEDPSFNNLSIEARLLFIGMISNADDYGYLRGDPGSLKRLIFGFDETTKEKIEELLEEIASMKNIHFFTNDKETYAHFIRWNDYQKQQANRMQASVYPSCSNCVADAEQMPKEVKLSKVKSSKAIDKSIGIDAKEEKVAKAYGDTQVNQVLEEFKSRIGQISSDSRPRQVAQNVRQLITSFIKHNDERFLRLRGDPLTFDYVHNRAWDWYMQKDYASSTEKLVTFKDKMKVYLDSVAEQLEKEDHEQT
jgi:hypothetical protein